LSAGQTRSFGVGWSPGYGEGVSGVVSPPGYGSGAALGLSYYLVSSPPDYGEHCLGGEARAPIDHVDIHVPSVYTGSLVALNSSLKGQVLGFDPHPAAKGWDVFRALLPGPMRDELFQSLGGMTHGTAWVESRFDHYEELHGKEAERIQAERAEAAA